MILANDITGIFKRTRYAKVGDHVKLIAEHGQVLIVENEIGERFSIRSDEVVDEKKPEAIVITPAPLKNKRKESIPLKQTDPVKKTGQQTLF